MKRIIIALVISLFVLNGFGQWKVDAIENSYTLENSYIMNYGSFETDKFQASYFPSKEVIMVGYLFDGLKFFDQSWDAILNNHGVIKSRDISIKWRVINSDKTYNEFSDDCEMNFSSVNNAGDPFFFFFLIYINPSLLKKGNYLTIKLEHPFLEDYINIKISLIGFTAAYNKAIK